MTVVSPIHIYLLHDLFLYSVIISTVMKLCQTHRIVKITFSVVYVHYSYRLQTIIVLLIGCEVFYQKDECIHTPRHCVQPPDTHPITLQ